MGTITFLLPPDLSREAVQVLARAYLSGGQDNMPFLTQVMLDNGRLLVQRDVEESGCLVAPWLVDGTGLVMTSSATVIERSEPYHASIELARGKVNQVRMQASDWLLGGLEIPAVLSEAIQEATRRFGQAVAQLPRPEAGAHAQTALTLSHRAAADLVAAYVRQVLQLRHERQTRLETAMGCRLEAPVTHDADSAAFLETFNTVVLPLSWSEVEPAEGEYHTERADAVLDWAERNHLAVVGGPLVDFSAARLPDWLSLWQGDLSSMVAYLCDYVELVVQRYRGRIRTWQVTANSNAAEVLSLGEDELLWLTVRLVEAVRHADPDTALIVGVSQPWGEQMAVRDRKRSPFEFADTLVRAGLNLAALDLELVTGVAPRGSYCRDLLETSRLIDLYSLLGVPLQITLGYPSATMADPLADPELAVDAGHWREGISAASQADWTATFAELALCKPAVRAVHWVHFTDAAPHQFPHCGLSDSGGQVKPALAQLRALRQLHLR